MRNNLPHYFDFTDAHAAFAEGLARKQANSVLDRIKDGITYLRDGVGGIVGDRLGNAGKTISETFDSLRNGNFQDPRTIAMLAALGAGGGGLLSAIQQARRDPDDRTWGSVGYNTLLGALAGGGAGLALNRFQDAKTIPQDQPDPATPGLLDRGVGAAKSVGGAAASVAGDAADTVASWLPEGNGGPLPPDNISLGEASAFGAAAGGTVGGTYANLKEKVLHDIATKNHVKNFSVESLLGDTQDGLSARVNMVKLLKDSNDPAAKQTWTRLKKHTAEFGGTLENALQHLLGQDAPSTVAGYNNPITTASKTFNPTPQVSTPQIGSPPAFPQPEKSKRSSGKSNKRPEFIYGARTGVQTVTPEKPLLTTKQRLKTTAKGAVLPTVAGSIGAPIIHRMRFPDSNYN